MLLLDLLMWKSQGRESHACSVASLNVPLTRDQSANSFPVLAGIRDPLLGLEKESYLYLTDILLSLTFFSYFILSHLHFFPPVC